MKFKIFLILAMVAVMTTPLFSVATGTTYNTTAYCSEDRYVPAVEYFGVTPATTALDSIGDFYTQALWIQPFTEYNAYFYLSASNGTVAGDEDSNVYIEYSFDRTTWFVGSVSSGKIYDQLGGTSNAAVSDTLNIAVGVEDTHYKFAPWCRLHFDLQAGNTIGSIITWRLKFFKPTGVTYPANKRANKL